ncbi:hypothetical protein AGMMS49992_29240 [Clostridia bacterium]|nr:hypothetical protein AGMMS49992_29240 [Clostridia bacterium]
MALSNGNCTYCGAGAYVQDDPLGDNPTQEQIDAMVTQQCKCDDAVRAKHEQRQAERFEGIVGEPSRARGFEPLEQYEKDALKKVRNLVGYHNIVAATIDLDDGSKLIIKVSKDNITTATRERKETIAG